MSLIDLLSSPMQKKPFFREQKCLGKDLRSIGYLLAGISLILFLSSCFGGKTVEVTTVQGENQLAELEAKDRALLQEIKKNKAKKAAGLDIADVIETTPHYTVSEYLKKYPEKRGTTSDYTVGPTDVLNVTVYEEPDLSREAIRVSGKGFISFPLIGRLEVNGLTPAQIEKQISEKLANQQYLLNAHVDVMVTGYNSKHYFVLGEVGTPGSHPIQAKERIMDALSKVGGVEEERASNQVMLIRTLHHDTPEEEKLVIDLDLTDLLKKGDQISNIYLHDRDVLYFQPVEQFYIIGQVHSPGAYNMPEGELTLVEAIGMAGGFTRIASRNSTRIVRIEDGVQKIIRVRVDQITDAGKKVQDVVIKPEDVIVIPESFF